MMRLDHDCIRDILLYVEENINEQNNRIAVGSLIKNMDSKYDAYTIKYHIIQLNQAGMFTHVTIPDGNTPLLIMDLSWEGHSYVDNIRDNKVWSKVKSSTKTLASISMPILIEYAKTVAMSFLPKP